MIGSLGLTASLLAIGASMQIKIAAATPGVTAASIGVFAGIVGYMAFHALSYGPCAARRRARPRATATPLPPPPGLARDESCRARRITSTPHTRPSTALHRLTPPHPPYPPYTPSQDHVARARRDLPVQHPRQGDGHRHHGQPRHLLRRGLHFPHHVRAARVERHLLPVRGLRRRARGAKRRRDHSSAAARGSRSAHRPHASSAPYAQPYAPSTPLPPLALWQLRPSCSTASSCPRRRACGSRRSRHSSVTPRPWSGATSAACARWWGDPSVKKLSLVWQENFPGDKLIIPPSPQRAISCLVTDRESGPESTRKTKRRGRATERALLNFPP